ncbi:unnamed protein product [Lampetra fluviatilis]
MGEDNVKVCVRIRPLIQRETSGSSVTYWKSDKHSMSQIDNNKSFIFDRVFGLDEQTYDVFDEIARPIIKAAVKGYNGTIFAYGQTSSGKTFTMMGSESYPGIIPLAMKEVFDVIKNLPGREFLLRVSYMEIYNETICDLLSKDKKKKSLEIHEDANRTVYVADLSEEVITSIKDILEIMRIGEKNRHYGETKMNDHSSRSHTIFRMIIESRERSQRESMDGVIAVSHLNLVDLAGSERTRQTGAEGLRLKEGCNINRSLFILGQVIKKLSENPSGVYLNYRDSKLTRILQNSLGGNAKTVILCTVTPAALEETLSTLMFASTAKNMKNSAHVNEVINDEAMLKCCRREIMNLKKELMQVSVKTQMHQAQAQQLAERDQLQRESEERIRSLKHMIINYSVTAAGAADDSAFARPKRRETWCPGLLRSHAKKFRGNSNMTDDLDLTSEENACLKLEWEMMGKDVEKVQAECAEASSRLLDCQSRLSAMEEQNSELNDELHAKNRGLDDANTSLKSLEEELSSLRMKLRENEDGNAQHDEDGPTAVQLLEERLTGFKDQVMEMKIINQDLATELALKELNLQKVEQSAKVSAEEIYTLQLSSDAAKAELERLKSLLEQKSEELDQWASSSMDEKIQLELQLASLRKEMEQLGEELQIARESKEQAGDSHPEMEASDAVARLSSLETKCEMLQSKLREKSNELDTLAGVLEENRSLQTKVESENQDLQDKVVKMSLEYEREICNNKTLSLLALIPPAPEKLKEEMSDSVAELLARVPILEEEKCRLEVALNAKTRELGSISDEAITIQQQLESAEKEIENLQMILDALNEESVNQYKLSSSESNRMNTMEEENESLRKKLEALLAHAAESDHVEVSNEADVNLEDKLRTRDEEKAYLQAQIEHVQAECEALTNAADDNAGRMRVVESELESARLRNEEMSITLLSVQAKLQEVDLENAQLRDHVNSANVLDDKLSTAMETILLLNEKLSSIQIEKQELQVRVDSLQTQSDELSTASNITALNSELQLLQEEKEALQSQFEDAVLRCERLSSISDELADLKVRFAMTEDEKESLQLQIDSLAKEKGDRYLKGAQEASMLEEKINVLEHEKRVLQILVDSDGKRGEELSAETEMISLKVKLQELQDQNEVLRSQMESSDVQCQHLSGRSNEVADLKSRLHKFVEENVMVQSCENSDGVKRDQLSASSHEVVFLKVKLQELQGEREQMQSQLYSLQLQCEQLSSAPDEIRDLKTRLGVLEEEKELLQTQLNSTHSQALDDKSSENVDKIPALTETELMELERRELQLNSAKAQQDEWADEMSTLKHNFQELQDEKKRLESWSDSLRLQCEQLSATSDELADLKTKLQVIKIENSDLKTRLQMLEAKEELLQTHLNSSTHSQELGDELAKTAEEISALKERLELVESEKADLQVQLDSAKTQQEQWSSATDELATLKLKLQALQDEKEQLELQFESLGLQCEQLSAASEIADLTTKLQVIEIENDDLKTRLRVLEEEKELFQTQLNSSTHSQELGDELAKTSEEFSALKERLELVEGEKADLQVQLDSAKTQQEQWSFATDELATLKLQLQALQDEKEQLELQFDLLRRQCEQLSAASDELADLKTKLQVIEIEDADLKTRVRVLEEEKELFQTQLNSSTHSQELSDELAKTAEEFSALKERLELVESEKADLQVQLDSAKTQQEQWSSATDELATLKLKLQALQDEKEQLELQFESLGLQCEQLSAASEIADLTTKLQVIEIENDDLKTRLRVLEEEKELFQTQLNSSTHSQELGDELAKTSEEFSALKERLELVEGEKADLQVQLDSAKTQQEQWSFATDELATLKLQLQALQDEKEQLELQFDLLRRQCEQLSAASDELADLKTKLQVIEIEDADLKTRVRVLEEEKELFQTQLNSSTHSQELSDELAKTAEEFSALKERLELVEGEKADLQVQLDSAKTQQDQWSSATDELTTLKLQLQALQDEKEQIELQFDLLRRQCEQLSAASDELADLKTKLQVIEIEDADLKTRVRVLEEEKELFQTQLNSSTHSQELGDELAKTAEEFSALKERLELVEGEKADLQVQLDSAKTQQDQWSSATDELTTLKLQLQALQDEKEQIELQFDLLRRQCEQLSAASDELADLKIKLQVIQNENLQQEHSRNKEMSAMKDRNLELQALIDSLQTQNDLLSTTSDEIVSLKAALEALQTEREELKSHLDFAKSQCEQLSFASEETSSLRSKLEMAVVESARLQSCLESANTQLEAIQIQAELLELQAKLKASQMKQKDMEKALQEKSTEVVRMQKRLMEAQSSAQAMQIQGELFELQEKMKASEMQHKDMEKALQEKSTEVVWLQKQLTEAQVSEQDLSARMSDLNGRCAKLSTDLSSREALVEQLQGSLSQEQRRTLDEEQRHSALVEELRAAHHSSESLRNESSEGLRDEVQVLSRQVAELEQQLVLAQEKNNNFIAEAAHHVEELNLMTSQSEYYMKLIDDSDMELKEEKNRTKELLARVASLESQLQAATAGGIAGPSGLGELQQLKEKLTEKLQELLASGNDGKEEAVALRAKVAKMVLRESELEQRVIRRDSQLCDLKRQLQVTGARILMMLLNSMQVLMKPNKPDADGKESEDVKYEIARLQLEKYKLESTHEKEVKSLKTTLSAKEQILRRLKEDLRAARQQADSTCTSRLEPHSASSGVVTCGGGSGVIQATALIILQNENTRLNNELKHLKLKMTSIKEGTMLVRLKDSATKYKRESEALRQNVKLLQSQLDLQKVESIAAAPPSPQLPPAPKTASDAPVGSLCTPTKRAKACIENKAPLSPRKNLMMPQPKKHYFEPGAPIALPSNVQFFDNSRLELSLHKRAPRSTADRDDEDFWKEPSHADQCKQQ